MNSKTKILFAAAALAASMTAQSALADVISYDATLRSPNTNAATADTGSGSNPSWYNGSGPGNPQGGWTVSTGTNGVELGLRAKVRSSAAQIDSPDNNYTVQNGSNGGYAYWNYEFSIDLRPGGVGALTFGDVTATLTITDVDTGKTATVNPLNYWSDNEGFGSTNGITNGGSTIPETVLQWGTQNSENAKFADFPLTALFISSGGAQGEIFYVPAQSSQYRFDLTVVTDAAHGSVTTSDTIFINPTPEPSTWVLLGGGLALLVLMQRRRSIA